MEMFFIQRFFVVERLISVSMDLGKNNWQTETKKYKYLIQMKELVTKLFKCGNGQFNLN